MASQIFRIYSQFVVWEAVSQTKRCHLPNFKHFGPPNFWAGYATGPRLQNLCILPNLFLMWSSLLSWIFFRFVAFFRHVLVVPDLQIKQTKKSLNYRNFTESFLCNIQSLETCGLRDRDSQRWVSRRDQDSRLITSMHGVTWNGFPITNLLIYSLLTPIVESTYLNLWFVNTLQATVFEVIYTSIFKLLTFKIFVEMHPGGRFYQRRAGYVRKNPVEWHLLQPQWCVALSQPKRVELTTLDITARDSPL